MNKFKLLTLHIGLLAGLIACSGDTDSATTINPGKRLLVFAQTGGMEEIKITSSANWKVSIPAESWCKATRQGDLLRVSVEENDDSEERKITLRLYSDQVEVPLEVEQLGTDPVVKVNKSTLNVAGSVLEEIVKITSNIEYEITSNDSWISVKDAPETRGVIASRDVTLLFEKNTTGKKKTGTVTIAPLKEEYKKLSLTIQVVQNFASMEAGDIKDSRIAIKSATANQQEQSQPWGIQDIMASLDGDISTHYHSPWSGSSKTVFPVILTYYLEEESELDYFITIPRQDSDHGAWGKTKIAFAYNGSVNFIEEFDTDLGQIPRTLCRFDFGKTFSGVTAVQFTISSGCNDRVTCAEMEFYKKSEGLDEELNRIFADELCSTLNADMNEEKINEIKSPFLKALALRLYPGGYDEFDQTFRVQEYDPYRPLADLQKELKTSGYNQFENPTGIFFKPGEEAIIFIGDKHDEPVNLKVYDFHAKSMGETRNTEIFPLYKGVNIYTIKQGGLAYIEYFTPNYKTAQPIRIHIASGQVNGYFEKGKTTLNEWKDILANAEYGHLDMKGKTVNLCYPVSESGGLREYCKDPEKLLDIYDRYIKVQHDMMGIDKYDRSFTNHMFIRTVPSSPGAAAYADGWGVGVYNSSTNTYNNETCATRSLWVIAHEFGHVNQVRPDLKWRGTTEVTNNCYAVCTRHEYLPWYEKFEDESHNDGRGKSIPGGLMNAAINLYMLKKDTTWILSTDDAFIRLCPLWQLLCYYRYVKGDETIPVKGGKYMDWYADMAEIARTSISSSSKSDGELQVAFMKNACDVLQADLSEFFENAGMLRPCDGEVDDYGKSILKITEAQCTEVKSAASKYTKPDAIINYMSANSIRIFKAEQPVTGTFGSGFTVNGTTITISHNAWKNVVAFETYSGNKCTYVAVMGTGYANSTGLTDVQPLPLPEKAATDVYFPAGSTAIYAVAWNGVRTLVSGSSNGLEDK